MDPVTVALGLAQVAPTIVKWLAGDSAAETAQKAIDVAKRIAGIDDPKAAVDAIVKDPALAMQFQQAWMAHELAMYQEETKRLETINRTMQHEQDNDDAFVRRARASLLWSTSFSIAFEVVVACLVVLFEPSRLGDLTNLFSALAIPQGIALAACGVYIKSKGDERQVAITGEHKTGLGVVLMQRLAGKAAAVLLLVALAGSAAIAAPPPGADLRFADWYASLYTAEGSLCCSVADCAPREWRTATDHYEVLIGDRWYPVPPRAVLNRNDNPTGKAVACFYGGEVRCFVKASES